MTNRCPYCGTGDHCQCALDHRHDKDAAQLRRDLEQIPDLYALLHLFVVKGSTGEGVIGGPSGSRPPMNLSVIDLLDVREKRDTEPTRTEAELVRDEVWGSRRQGVLPTLSSWVRLVDSERWDEGDEHQNPPTQRTVPGECGWLIESLDWITAQQWLPEMVKDIRKIRNDLRGTLREPPPARLKCLEPGCEWDVVPMDNGTWYRCTGCDASWPQIVLHRMAERKRPRPLKECAEAAGVPHRTLRYLVNEGLLKHVARDGNRNLYDIQDAVVAAAKVKIRTAPA